MYKLGDKVRISSENDNENYEDFRDKILVIQNISTSEKDTSIYDSSMNGMQLMDFTTEDEQEVPFSLYEYEVEPI